MLAPEFRVQGFEPDDWLRLWELLSQYSGTTRGAHANLFDWRALVREDLVRSSFGLLCPPGKGLVLGVFDRGELYTALVVQLGDMGIEALIGPRELSEPMGLLSGDWLRDYPHLIRAVETQYCPVAGGCFTQLSTLKHLLTNQVPGAFSRAVMARDVVLHPLNPALAVTLGVDVGWAALASMQSLTRRLRRSPLAGAKRHFRTGNGLVSILERMGTSIEGGRQVRNPAESAVSAASREGAAGTKRHFPTGNRLEE